MNTLSLLAVAAALASPSAEPPTVPELVAALRSDDIPGNATLAMDALMPMALEEHNAEALDHLRQAIHSDDPQQRLFATVLLAKRADSPLTTEMWETLITGMTISQESHVRLLSWEALCRRWPNGAVDRLSSQLPRLDLCQQVGGCALLMRQRRLQVSDVAVQEWWKAIQPGDTQLDALLERSLGSEMNDARHFAAMALLERQRGDIDPGVSRALIESLRDDESEIPNAHQVRNALRCWEGPWPDHLTHALEQALMSRDHQQSQLAALILSDRLEGDWWIPTREFWDVLVLGLMQEEPDGSTVFHGRALPQVSQNATNAWRVLHRYPTQATASLERAMREENTSLSQAAMDVLMRTYRGEVVTAYARTQLETESDPRRLAAASALAQVRDLESIDRITEVFLLHLAGDTAREDTRRATSALYRLGPEAIPWIESFADYPPDPALSQRVGRIVNVLRRREAASRGQRE